MTLLTRELGRYLDWEFSISAERQKHGSRRPMVIGEVLFDHFPNGRMVLGGAPFNIAWNLQGLGQRPHFVSAVGHDKTGEEVLKAMRAWGMGTGAVQIRNDRKTGVVQVSLDSGQPTYEILPDQAYDFVSFEDLQAEFGVQLENVAVLYHGSLAWRSSTTRNAISELRRRAAGPIFVDLNIRHPWIEPEWLDGILAGVQWVKLNVDELSEITGCLIGEDASESRIAEAVGDLMERFPCEVCFVSAGASGAFAVDAGGDVCHAQSAEVKRLVDTVGAGDAFAAMAIHGLLEQWSLPEILERAVSFAAQICQVNGATLNDPAVYAAALHRS